MEEATVTATPPDSAVAPSVLPPATGKPPQPQRTSGPPWTEREKFWFRAMFVCFGIYTLNLIQMYWIPQLFYKLPKRVQSITQWSTYVISTPARWLATKLIPDCKASFACWPESIVWLVIMSIAVAAIWTLLDRSRPDYRRLYQWLRVLLRYWLGYIIWMYAWMKFAGVQFGVGPDADDLMTTLGQTSKMRLMWGSMGYSATYALFTAVGEALGAALVLWRRTTTLGALLIAVIMLNVFFLDLAHHVSGVAEASLMYMAQALILAAPDARRLWGAYVQNRYVPPVIPEPPLFNFRWRPLVKAVLVIGVALRPTFIFSPKIGRYWIKRPQNAVVGTYRVTQFMRQGGTIPPFVGDSTRWDVLAVSVRDSAKGSLRIRRMDGSWADFGLELDSIHHTLTATVPGTPPPPKTLPKKGKPDPKAKPDTTTPPPKKVGQFAYVLTPAGTLHLSGQLSGVNLDILFERIVNERTRLWRGTHPFAVPR